MIPWKDKKDSRRCTHLITVLPFNLNIHQHKQFLAEDADFGKAFFPEKENTDNSKKTFHIFFPILVLSMCLFIILAKYLKNIFITWFIEMMPCLISNILYFLLWRELQDKEMKYYNNFWDTRGLNISNENSCEVILKCPGTKSLSVISFWFML